MNVAALTTKVWTRLNLSSTNDFFTSAEILGFFNDGYKDFQLQTECLKKFTLLDVTAGTTAYDLPSDCLQPIWIGYDDEGIEPVSLTDLDKTDENWVGRSGHPFAFVQVFDGFDKIQLYETPNVSSTALSAPTTAITDFEDWLDNLLLFYAYEPDDLTTGTPDLETPFQWALIYYACWKAFDCEGDFQDPFQAEFYKLRYQEMVAEKKNQIAESLVTIIGSEESNFDLEERDTLEFNPGDEIEYELKDILILEIPSDGRLSFGDDDQNGTWKISRSGNDLLQSRRESGTYTEKSRFEA